jgi:hypothetical protein
VKVGPKRGDQVALLEGVQAGEEVVTAGQGKLRPGTARHGQQHRGARQQPRPEARRELSR